MEKVPLVDAPLAAENLPKDILLLLLRDPRPSLIVPALLIPTVAPRHALSALVALNLMQVQPK